MGRKPKPQTAKLLKTSIAIRDDLWKALKIAAIEDGEQVQGVIARLVEAYLKDREQKKRRKG